MENSPCEYCGIKNTCGKTKGCNRWKKWMRDAWEGGRIRVIVEEAK